MAFQRPHRVYLRHRSRRVSVGQKIKKTVSTSPLHRPYIAPLRPGRGNRIKHDYNRNIIFSIQYRGDNDDIPYILYLGAPYALVRDVYVSMRQTLGTHIGDIRVYHEHPCVYRHGKSYQRMAVKIVGLDNETLTLDSLLLMAHKKMQTLCWCKVTSVPLSKLLNL